MNTGFDQLTRSMIIFSGAFREAFRKASREIVNAVTSLHLADPDRFEVTFTLRSDPNTEVCIPVKANSPKEAAEAARLKVMRDWRKGSKKWERDQLPTLKDFRKKPAVRLIA